MIEIKMITKSGILPVYETSGSSGMDLRAYLPDEDEITLKPMERKLIPTGLFMELPKGYEAQIRARSGLSIKHGITMVNGVGTVDSDYRGELKVPVINLGNETYIIKNGERIAQMVIAKYEQVKVESVEIINETERADGGFGHTGIK